MSYDPNCPRFHFSVYLYYLIEEFVFPQQDPSSADLTRPQHEDHRERQVRLCPLPGMGTLQSLVTTVDLMNLLIELTEGGNIYALPLKHQSISSCSSLSSWQTIF